MTIEEYIAILERAVLIASATIKDYTCGCIRGNDPEIEAALEAVKDKEIEWKMKK